MSEIDISSVEFSQNPYAVYDRLRGTGNIYHLPASSCWLVIGYDEIVEVLGNHDAFTSSGAAKFDPLLIGCDPPEHTHNRKMLEGTDGPFSKGHVKGMEDRVREICKSLIASIPPEDHFDLVSQFAAPLSSLVILELMGIVPDHAKLVREWTSTAVSNRSLHNEEFHEVLWGELKPLIEEWVRESSGKTGVDVLTHVINYEGAAGQFSENEIVNLIKILLIGGSETTPNLIANAIRTLGTDNELNERVRSDSSLIPKLIHESLRHEAPTQIIHRNTTADVEIGGVTIPKDSLVALAIGAANRDPDRFDKPELFDVDRDSGKILSFGFGPHYCIGAQLAKLEAVVAVEELLNHFTSLQVHPDFSPVYHLSSHIRGLASLPLITTSQTVETLGIEAAEDSALQLIRDSIDQFGHIPTFQNFPNFEQKRDKGWHYTYPSPFVHATAIYSLLNSGSEQAKNLAMENVAFLKDTMETGGLWRFWKLNDCENPVPPDIDDISICSFVLEKLGFAVDNKRILESNIDQEGHILTWIFPSVSMLFSNPMTYYSLHRTRHIIKPTVDSGMLHPSDSEIGVSANALMYLGENTTTEKAIQKCIDDWRNSCDSFNFYGSKLVVGFHLARAYNEGIGQFIELKESILKMINDELEHYQFPELLIAFLTLNYFNHRDEVTSYIECRIKNHCLLPNHVFDHYPYFTSKDRVFFAGSRCLTAAWFLEVIEKISVRD